jgi:hypothetical protein
MIIKAKAFVPTTDRAWTMTVLQKLGIHPKHREQIFPVSLGYVADFAHVLGPSGKGIQ